MTLLGLLFAFLLILGIAYIVNKVLVLDATIRLIANVIILVVVILWLLSVTGLIHTGDLRLTK